MLSEDKCPVRPLYLCQNRCPEALTSLTVLSNRGDRQAAPSVVMSSGHCLPLWLEAGVGRGDWCRVSHRYWIWCKEAATEMVSPLQGWAIWTKDVSQLFLPHECILIHMMKVAVVVDGWGVGPFPGIFPTNAQSTKKELFLILC